MTSSDAPQLPPPNKVLAELRKTRRKALQTNLTHEGRDQVAVCPFTPSRTTAVLHARPPGGGRPARFDLRSALQQELAAGRQKQCIHVLLRGTVRRRHPTPFGASLSRWNAGAALVFSTRVRPMLMARTRPITSTGVAKTVFRGETPD